MSKYFMLMTAAAALVLGGVAFAETTTPTAAQAPAAASAPDTMAASAAAPAAASAKVAVGLPVKDKTGAMIGTITEVKPDTTGAPMATIKMGTDSFSMAAANMGVQDGVATVNASKAEIVDMIKKSKS